MTLGSKVEKTTYMQLRISLIKQVSKDLNQIMLQGKYIGFNICHLGKDLVVQTNKLLTKVGVKAISISCLNNLRCLNYNREEVRI